jgi:hypothetical protein
LPNITRSTAAFSTDPTTFDDNKLQNIKRNAKKIYSDLSQRASNISVSGIITYKFETLLCLSVRPSVAVMTTRSVIYFMEIRF